MFGDDDAVEFASTLSGSHDESLKFSCRHLGVRGLSAIMDALPFSNVTSLHLSRMKVGDQCATIIARALSKLVTLGLAGCGITDVGVEALCAALPTSSVNIIHLGENPITDVGAAMLATILNTSKLQYIDLWHAAITDVSTFLRAIPFSRLHSLLITCEDDAFSKVTRALVHVRDRAKVLALYGVYRGNKPNALVKGDGDFAIAWRVLMFLMG